MHRIVAAHQRQPDEKIQPTLPYFRRHDLNGLAARKDNNPNSKIHASFYESRMGKPENIC